MKYDIAIIASILMVTVLIGVSYLDSERTDQHVVTVRATVSSLSVQQLAPEVRACDRFRGRYRSREPRIVYCAEVTRAMDSQPLQAVVIRRDFRVPAPHLQRPMLQKITLPVSEEPKAPIFNQDDGLRFY
jgi:hypothetical protein